MRIFKYVLLSSAVVLSAGLLCRGKLAAQSSPDAAQPLRVYTREVVLDVNVTDAKGNFVHGLTRGNFTVLNDGKPITPSSFREHRSDDDAGGPAAAKSSLPPNTFSNAGQPEGVHPLNLLLLDSLDLPSGTQAIVRQRMAEFVNKLPPGTPVAVFSLSTPGQLSLLQGFTTDRELLKKAVKSDKLNLQIPPLEDFGQEPTDNSDGVTDANSGKKAAKVIHSEEPKFDATQECNHVAARGAYTFAALSQIARYVSGMPGRKNLIWYTGLFPTSMKDKEGTQCVDFRDDVRTVGEQLGHSDVVIYPVDPRALDVLAKEGPDSRIGRLLTVEDLRMEGLADDSGGKAFYKNNDLAGAGLQAIDAGSNYYTISFTPADQRADTRRHDISISVDQPDFTLVYRHTYHAVAPGETVSGQKIQKATPLQTAMMRGALEPSEVLFHVTVAPVAAPETSLAPGNNPDPKEMKPPYRHLSVAYNIDISGIQFDPSSDGAYHGQFEYAVNVYDPRSGKLVNSNVMAAKPALPFAVYQSMLTSGAKLRQEIDVPSTGEYILRVGVHDLTTDHVGALEFPLSAVRP